MRRSAREVRRIAARIKDEARKADQQRSREAAEATAEFIDSKFDLVQSEVECPACEARVKRANPLGVFTEKSLWCNGVAVSIVTRRSDYKTMRPSRLVRPPIVQVRHESIAMVDVPRDETRWALERINQ